MITNDRCVYRHDCDWSGHMDDALPLRPEKPIVIDYDFQCPECGQRWHVTGRRYENGAGDSHAERMGKPSRKWRKAQRHPQTTDGTPDAVR